MNWHHFFFFTTAFTRSCRARAGRSPPRSSKPSRSIMVYLQRRPPWAPTDQGALLLKLSTISPFDASEYLLVRVADEPPARSKSANDAALISFTRIRLTP